MDTQNEQVLFSKRPVSVPGPEHFTFARTEVREPADGEVVLQTLLVSVDPAMRVWMNEAPGYFEPMAIGSVMRSGGVARVVMSASEAFSAGDLVQGRIGWQSRPTVPAKYLQKLDESLGTELDWIGPLGGTALTAFVGLEHVGQIALDDVVLVSAAAGGVGQMAGQIARLKGAKRVVGIAGGEEKSRFVVEALGFDEAIDYRDVSDMAEAIGRSCPDGIDLYFDNVGGAILEAALSHIRSRARVVLCGRISQTASPSPYGVRNIGELIGKRGRAEGFIVSDFSAHFDAARRWLAEHVKAGNLTQRLHILEGLSEAPRGLQMLFESKNTGKLVVRVS